MNGTIGAVETRRAGAQLAEAVTAGSVLTLTNVADFNPDGGTLVIDSGPAAAPQEYVEASEASATVTLTAPVTLPAGLMIYVEPPVFETVASVVVDPLDPLIPDRAAVRAVVPYTMRAVLPEGVREPGRGEMVHLGVQNGRLTVLDVLDALPPVTLPDVAFEVDSVIDDVARFKDTTLVVVGAATGKPPALTGNTTAGTITWPSFTVEYQGATGAYSAGSTSARYVTVPKTLEGSVASTGASIPADSWVIFINNSGVPTDVQNSQFVDGSLVVDGTLTAQALEADLVLASRIIAGAPSSTHAELDPDGLTVYRPGPDGGGPLVSARLGTPGVDDFLQVFSNTSGQAVATINQNGGVIAQKASLGNAAGDVLVNGQPFEAYFDSYPRGLVDYGVRDSNGPATSGTGNELKWLEVQTVLLPGRLYRIQLAPTYVNASAAATTGLLVMRYATGGAAVTTGSSTQLQSTKVYCPAADMFTSPPLAALINTTALSVPTEHRFLTSYITYGPGNVFPVASASLPSILTVEDIGKAKAQVGINFGAPVPPATRQNYVSYWSANASASYRGDGVKRTDTTDIVCGPDPSGFNGNGCGLALFTAGAYASSNPSELGKGILTALSGATITGVEVYAYANHTYYGAGGTLRYVGGTYTILPATFTNAPSNYYGAMTLGAGEGKYGPLKIESLTSVAFGQTPSDYQYYVRLNGATVAHPPVLKITYTR